MFFWFIDDRDNDPDFLPNEESRQDQLLHSLAAETVTGASCDGAADVPAPIPLAADAIIESAEETALWDDFAVSMFDTEEDVLQCFQSKDYSTLWDKESQNRSGIGYSE